MIIEEIKVQNKKYPNQLRQIYDPPKKIYVLGNTKILEEKSIAIVGTRKCTTYGKNISLQIAKKLSQKGINIISGLAIGIDTYSHIGALDGNGNTIAVLGTPLDQIYPRENRELANNIIKNGGCLISEYPIGSIVKKENFVQRNRLISGIADAVLIVEAGKKSGALITADFALEQGKEVFAIPGNITSKESEGCNLLIRDGAKMILSIEDILNEIF